MPRRKARAIAISATAEGERKIFAMKILAILALGIGLLDTVWTVHYVMMAH